MILYNNSPAGFIGQLNPLKFNDKIFKAGLYVCEIYLEPFLKDYNEIVEYREISRYPRVRRDLSLVIKNEIEAGKLINTIKEINLNILRSISVFDIYSDHKIGKENICVGLKLTFQSKDRTLSEKELDKTVKMIIKKMEERYGAKLRI